MKNQNTIITLIAAIAVVLITLKVSSWYYNKKLEANEIALRTEKIKSSELAKIKDGLYTKLVADTLTIKELKKKNDSLGLALKNPKTITVVKFKPRDKEAPIEDIEVNDSLIDLKDYYPNKQNPFVTYTAKVDKFSETGIGKFSFTPQEFRLGIGLNKDGTYSVNTKVPEYFEITGVDVEAAPMTPQKSDNFGWIAGVQTGKNFLNANNLYGVSAGIRYKKLYLDTDLILGDNEAIGLIGIKLEF